MTPLKKRLDEKREKDAEEKIPWPHFTVVHPVALQRRNDFKIGAAPRDELLAFVGNLLTDIKAMASEDSIYPDEREVYVKSYTALNAIEKFLGEEK